MPIAYIHKCFLHLFFIPKSHLLLIYIPYIYVAHVLLRKMQVVSMRKSNHLHCSKIVFYIKLYQIYSVKKNNMKR